MALTDHTGVVLAGGTSRRFADGNKALATMDGKPLVGRVVARLAEAVGEPVVVAVRTTEQRDDVGDALADVAARTTFVRDAEAFEGPLAGVVAAVERVETSRVVLVAGDMPLLDPGTVEWLAGIDGGSDAVVPVVDRPQPLQAVYRTSAIGERVADLPRSVGLSALLDELSVTYVHASDAPDAVAAEQSLTNVNTVEDLAAVVADGSS